MQITKILTFMMSLAVAVSAFGMQNAPQNAQNQQICSICGRNNTPVQTITKNHARTTNDGRWVYNYNPQFSFQYKSKICKTCHAKNCTCYTYQPLHYTSHYVPNHEYRNEQCSHIVCATCIGKSSLLYPNAHGCKLCPYIQARMQHAQCNLCASPVDQLLGGEYHNHGLCNHHNIQIQKLHTLGCGICYVQNNPNILNQQQCDICQQNNKHIDIKAACTHKLCDQHYRNAQQFKYSPIDSIKEIWQGNGCTSCFIQNNPGAISCETRKHYWGEVALIAGAAGTASLVVYGAYKAYHWWKGEEVQEKNQEEANPVEL